MCIDAKSVVLPLVDLADPETDLPVEKPGRDAFNDGLAGGRIEGWEGGALVPLFFGLTAVPSIGGVGLDLEDARFPVRFGWRGRLEPVREAIAGSFCGLSSISSSSGEAFLLSEDIPSAVEASGEEPLYPGRGSLEAIVAGNEVWSEKWKQT